jgi:hypothetical protein
MQINSIIDLSYKVPISKGPQRCNFHARRKNTGVVMFVPDHEREWQKETHSQIINSHLKK